MSASPTPSRTSNAEGEAYKYIIDVVYARSGIRLHQGKETLIQARLGKRLRQLGLATLPQSCDFLRHQAGEDEFEKVVNALSTNFTNFLREEDHFKFLVENALPAVLPQHDKHFHVWSAACSSGEEPYSIGFYLSEHYPLSSGWNWKIVATDISTKVLDTARLGLYSEDRVQTLPREWLRKYFQKGVGDWQGYYRIKRSFVERVDFRQLNLIGDYSHPQTFSVIFCRNVMIYFDRPTQEQLINQMCRFLAPGGFLLIGHAETLNGLRVPLRCLRPSIYQKTVS